MSFFISAHFDKIFLALTLTCIGATIISILILSVCFWFQFFIFADEKLLGNSKFWILTGGILLATSFLLLSSFLAFWETYEHCQGSKVCYKYTETDTNYHKSLDYLKDWSSNLITIETAIIAAAIAIQGLWNNLKPIPSMFIIAAIITVVFSMYFNGRVIYMLPAIAQRKPVEKNKDVYSLTIDSTKLEDTKYYISTSLPLGFWCLIAWRSFICTLILILIFIFSETYILESETDDTQLKETLILPVISVEQNINDFSPKVNNTQLKT